MRSILTPVNIKFLLNGLGLTLYIAVITIVLSLVLGIVLAVMRNSSIKILNRISTIYIELFRNTPLLLWILAMRFLVRIGAVNSGILALTLFTASIIAEIVRGGLNSIKIGQYEAAYSQGFSEVQVLAHIILPQAIRNMMPSLLSQFVTVIKDTSFLWAAGIEELTGRGMILMGSFATSDQVFMLFILLSLIYFIINFILSTIIRSQQFKFATT
jgi:putative glutamine transport system permease protein